MATSLKLALTDNDLAPLDLLDRSRFKVVRNISYTKWAQPANGMRTLQFPIMLYPPAAANWNLIANKLFGASQGIGPFGIAQQNVVLIAQFTGESVNTYIDVTGGYLDAGSGTYSDFYVPGGYRNSIVMLTCLPYGRGAPVTVGPYRLANGDRDQAYCLTIAGGAGTFTLTKGANTTSAQAFNVTAANLQTALTGLASIGAGNCTVYGPTGGPYIIRFAGTLGNQAVTLTTNGGSGGATATLTVSTSGAIWIPDAGQVTQSVVRVVLDDKSAANVVNDIVVGTSGFANAAPVDMVPVLGVVAQSPGTSHSDVTARRGASARLTPTTSAWQAVGRALIPNSGHSNGRKRVLALVKASDVLVGAPTAIVTTVSTKSGSLGSGNYELVLVPRDGSGNVGTNSQIVSVTIANLTQGSGGPYALNPLDFDFFLTNVFQNWIAPPLLTVGSGGGGVATGVLDTTAAVGNPFGYHAKAVGGVSAASSVLLQRILKPLPTSGAYGIRMPFVPITIANGRGGSPANATAEFNFITVAGGAGIGIQFDSSASVWRVCSANSNIGPSFTMPIAATTVNGNQSLPASTINITSASSFLAASATAPHFAQIDGQLIQYTGKSGTTLTGCTGGTGTITSGHAVNQAFMLEFLFQSAGAGYSFTVSVDGAEASGYTASTQNFFQPQMLTIQAQAATGNANSEEFYVGEYDCADNAIGAGTSFNGGSITVNATLGSNTSTVDLDYFVSGGSVWYQLSGVTLPYTLTQQLPPGVKIITAPPSTGPVAIPSQIRASVGLQANTTPVLIPGPAKTPRLGNSKREWLDLGGFDFATRNRWNQPSNASLVQIEASNPNGGTTIDCEAVALFDDLPAQRAELALATLASNEEWDFDTRPDLEASAVLRKISDSTIDGEASVSGPLTIPNGGAWLIAAMSENDGSNNIVGDAVGLEVDVTLTVTPMVDVSGGI